MKININQIPAEGLKLEAEIPPKDLYIESEEQKFLAPVKIKADIFKVINAVIAKFSLESKIRLICIRCLEEFEWALKKNFQLEYLVDKKEEVIDFVPDIREEIILDFPFKPLCKADCKGLCAKCGKNLNQGGCSCATT